VRALLIANASDADPGFVGERLRRHGYAFDECHRERPGQWPDLDGHDLVLLLGSDWSVYWPHIADEVAAETALVREAHRRGTPVFGICFGAQMVAHALGGRVERSATPEIGWLHVDSDVDAIGTGPWMQWHSDRFSVPPGFAELARSEVGPQAVLGARTFATQFHPEATETIVRRWICGGGAVELADAGIDPDGLIDATRHEVGASRGRADALVDWFMESVVGS
jgi:GMP synthase-like glutamine amidotransferase